MLLEKAYKHRTLAMKFVIFFGLASTLLAGSKTTIVKKELILSNDIKKKIKALDRDFNVYKNGSFIKSISENYNYTDKQNLFSIIDDIDGDSFQDMIFLGENKTHHRVLVYLSTRKTVIPVTTFSKLNKERNWVVVANPGKETIAKEHGQWIYLTHVPPGTKTSTQSDKTVKLKYAGFVLRFHNMAEELFYFEDGEIKRFTLKD